MTKQEILCRLKKILNENKEDVSRNDPTFAPYFAIDELVIEIEEDGGV